ncbi:MAG: F0F1 ATP synthase subunit epsilon [Clostridia bacterium]|nr:F0F1 ATP synthase subunit epsilon [Clostridia bacterium]
MRTFLLNISSPDGKLFSGEAVMMTLRGIEGDLAVMAGHVPFITSVKPCDVKLLLPDGTEKIGHSDGGLLTVAADGVTLLGSFHW